LAPAAKRGATDYVKIDKEITRSRRAVYIIS